MKRTPFKIKVARSHSLARKSAKAYRLKPGKRTKEWDRVRAKLKKEFAAKGITTCELKYEGCKNDDWLSFAHGRKRRKLEGDELKTLTILACNPCHDRVEFLPAEEMLRIVENVITNRG
jgi:hypothetical protein